MRFRFPPLAIFLLLLGVWPWLRISHETQPTTKTIQIQKGPAAGPLTTEERPIQVERHSHRLQIGFPFKPAFHADYTRTLERPLPKPLEPSSTTEESTSFLVATDLIGLLLSGLCIAGAAALFFNHLAATKKSEPASTPPR